VKALGVEEPKVRSDGTELVVELPKQDDLKGAVSYLKAQGLLEFRYVDGLKSVRNPVSKIGWQADRDERTGEETIIFTNNKTGEEMTHAEVLAGSELVVAGKDLDVSATKAVLQMGEPVVCIAFNEEGAARFADFTRRHIDDALPIVLDGEVISVPGIRSAITGGRGVISGGLSSMREAELLAGQLRAGAYPVPLELIRVEAIEHEPGPFLVGSRDSLQEDLF
jgi:preprotein translocase subunit SecD